MDDTRLNRAGIPREELISFLKIPARLRRALQKGKCLLCCGNPVNEVCLCISCFPLLTDAERAAAAPYLSGELI